MRKVLGRATCAHVQLAISLVFSEPPWFSSVRNQNEESFGTGRNGRAGALLKITKGTLFGHWDQDPAQAGLRG